jgi:hypothetical protein
VQVPVQVPVQVMARVMAMSVVVQPSCYVIAGKQVLVTAMLLLLRRQSQPLNASDTSQKSQKRVAGSDNGGGDGCVGRGGDELEWALDLRLFLPLCRQQSRTLYYLSKKKKNSNSDHCDSPSDSDSNQNTNITETSYSSCHRPLATDALGSEHSVATLSLPEMLAHAIALQDSCISGSSSCAGQGSESDGDDDKDDLDESVSVVQPEHYLTSKLLSPTSTSTSTRADGTHTPASSKTQKARALAPVPVPVPADEGGARAHGVKKQTPPNASALSPSVQSAARGQADAICAALHALLSRQRSVSARHHQSQSQKFDPSAAVAGAGVDKDADTGTSVGSPTRNKATDATSGARKVLSKTASMGKVLYPGIYDSSQQVQSPTKSRKHGVHAGAGSAAGDGAQAAAAGASPGIELADVLYHLRVPAGLRLGPGFDDKDAGPMYRHAPHRGQHGRDKQRRRKLNKGSQNMVSFKV